MDGSYKYEFQDPTYVPPHRREWRERELTRTSIFNCEPKALSEEEIYGHLTWLVDSMMSFLNIDDDEWHALMRRVQNRVPINPVRNFTLRPNGLMEPNFPRTDRNPIALRTYNTYNQITTQVVYDNRMENGFCSSAIKALSPDAKRNNWYPPGREVAGRSVYNRHGAVPVPNILPNGVPYKPLRPGYSDRSVPPGFPPRFLNRKDYL